MGTREITLTEAAHELARREVMRAAAEDMQNAAEMLEELNGATWPMEGAQVADTRASFGLVRESLAAVDALGWPETERAD